ncbi:hypothetical protein [Salinibacterium sp. PAMC 21357]|uniref:hypothetical protein n=1 Tax=Salinibacterium sp. PAMC 21357 TaxID=1112215 RepID=UPI0011472932|nr:hypothetical protein [Salinibacterium sp. PAMC 21357]
MLLLPFLVLLPALVALFAFASFSPLYRLVMLLLTVGLLCVIPFLVSLWTNAVPNKIRIATSTPLRFVSKARTWIFPILGTLLIALSGAVIVWAQYARNVEPISLAIGGRVGGWTLLVGGGAALVYLLRKFRIPRGLGLSQEGLRWWRGAEEIFLPWGQLVEVRFGAGAAGTAKIAQIVERDENLHDVAPLLVGSDPSVVAEVIHFFLTNPNRREALTEPQTALALVAEPC